MMLGTYSYHEIFRKTVVAFGTLFNNIELRRTDEVMKVPLAYGPKQKFLARLDQTPDPTNKRVQITLPRISFEINGITYDSSRKVSPTQKIKIAKDTDENKNVFMPVPYNLSFELAIISKTQEDGLQILEQILPYFQPHYNLPVKLLPDANETKDVPVVLNSVDYEDDYEGDFSTRRAIIYTLQFTVKTYLYGPVTDSKVIKKVITDYYTDTNTTTAPREVRYTIQPDPIDADADDDFGFGIVDEDFTDNKKRNPVSGVDEEI
ncbi:tail sheath stabilizer [Synechococcus phage S-RIM8 A.HR3]|uniref:Tail sheath stabilizer n=2 Tax=Neptunevirus srim18 TaxID=2734121 RepID=H6BI52_9CAUD|nr:tail sheath stabilizer [Synechococcus phage S-RIM8 A.HR1]AFB15371.1 tail sheath stabilizer [Synechococcus phage S-RIM8 A.HR5]AFB17586.1 tail sheath stabilizer [Synechococcus phage S-RIM8 A.HR1]AFB17797.1 tail sheath stabilizer [Synechococcus phage S-RIM8 A.HR3]AGH57951.1 tail sheath stabilizer [Synechococcus phage KBS-M-1A]